MCGCQDNRADLEQIPCLYHVYVAFVEVTCLRMEQGDWPSARRCRKGGLQAMHKEVEYLVRNREGQSAEIPQAKTLTYVGTACAAERCDLIDIAFAVHIRLSFHVLMNGRVLHPSTKLNVTSKFSELFRIFPVKRLQQL